MKKLVMDKNKSNGTVLECRRCKEFRFIVVPHYQILVGKQKRNTFIIPELKNCQKCKTLYLDLETNEYWTFPRGLWRKTFKSFEDLTGFDNREKASKLKEVVKGDLRRKKACDCGGLLKIYDYNCERCKNDVSIIPL